MKDRDIALGYQKVKDGSAYELYNDAYGRLNDCLPDGVKFKNLGKVFCLNDNFGLNSLIKKHNDCESYDTLVLNHTHQKYCFNVFPELLIDSFYTEVPDLDDYDTIIIDNANIDAVEFERLLNLCDEQVIICMKDCEITDVMHKSDECQVLEDEGFNPETEEGFRMEKDGITDESSSESGSLSSDSELDVSDVESEEDAD